MKFIKYLTIAAVALSMTACSDSNTPDNDDELSTKEQSLQRAAGHVGDYDGILLQKPRQIGG